ncbi:MAG: NAD(P)/FAD-dependent oxidoreductase [Polyangiales bacterium]
MTQANVDFDVGIIGGGPAGAALASYLAKEGISTVVFERELFPRPHVGESLVPSSTRVFKELGFLETMEEAKFPHKFGAVWTAADSNKLYSHDWKGLSASSYADVAFAERAQPGVDRDYTYHVDRGKFDLLLLQHAQKLGATVYEGVSVRHADFSNPDFVKVQFQLGKSEHDVKVKLIVDASGRRTILGKQLDWRIRDKVFDQYAIHTWFDGYDRTIAAKYENRTEYIYIHFLPITNSWIWQIPITDTITSVGVVTQKKHFAKTKESREAFFWEAISTRPELYEGLRASQQVRPFTDEGDYSYAMKQITGDRVVLIGDAARFVDPIFSTGVSIALNGARLSSRDIVRAVQTNNFKREAFANYENTIRRGTKNWYEFITVYYRLNVLFTAFVRDPNYRLDVLKLLQGDVYDEEAPPVLEKMKEIVTAVERDPNHIWHPFLGDLTANAFSPDF